MLQMIKFAMNYKLNGAQEAWQQLWQRQM